MSICLSSGHRCATRDGRLRVGSQHHRLAADRPKGGTLRLGEVLEGGIIGGFAGWHVLEDVLRRPVARISRPGGSYLSLRAAIRSRRHEHTIQARRRRKVMAEQTENCYASALRSALARLQKYGDSLKRVVDQSVPPGRLRDRAELWRCGACAARATGAPDGTPQQVFGDISWGKQR
jgi:hypothetical protein